MIKSCSDCACEPVCVINKENVELLNKLNFAKYSYLKEQLGYACKYFKKRDV